MVALGFYGSKIELFISASEVADTWTEFIITDQKYLIQLESTKTKTVENKKICSSCAKFCYAKFNYKNCVLLHLHSHASQTDKGKREGGRILC